MKQFITEPGSRVEAEDMFEIHRAVSGFFFHLSGRRFTWVLSGIQLACRQFEQLFLHGVAELPDKGNQTVVPDAEEHNSSRVPNHFADRGPAAKFKLIHFEADNPAVVNALTVQDPALFRSFQRSLSFFDFGGPFRILITAEFCSANSQKRLQPGFT